MVEHSPKILASEEEATTTTTMQFPLFLVCQKREFERYAITPSCLIIIITTVVVTILVIVVKVALTAAYSTLGVKDRTVKHYN